jgi:hypothetical protein
MQLAPAMQISAFVPITIARSAGGSELIAAKLTSASRSGNAPATAACGCAKVAAGQRSSSEVLDVIGRPTVRFARWACSGIAPALRGGAMWMCSGPIWLLLGALLYPPHVRAEASEACVSSYESAQVLRMRGRYLEARNALLVCVQSSCPQLLQTDCVSWLSEVEASLPSIVIAVIDTRGNDIAGARVSANGKPLAGWVQGRALALDPGVYALRFEAPGHRPVQQTLTVHEGEKNRMVRARLAAGDAEDPEESEDEHADEAVGVSSGQPQQGASDPPRIPLATYILGGASLASLGAFSYFALAGKSEYDDLEKSCAPDCPRSRTEDGRRAYILADVALGVSVASAAAALWVYFAAESDASEETPGVQVNVGARGASVGWAGRF